MNTGDPVVLKHLETIQTYFKKRFHYLPHEEMERLLTIIEEDFFKVLEEFGPVNYLTVTPFSTP